MGHGAFLSVREYVQSEWSGWQAVRERGALAGHVAVDGFYLIAGFLQALGHFFGHHYAAVLAAGAAEGYGEVALTFLDIVREQVEHEVGDLCQEFLGLGEFADKGGDFGVLPGELAELWDEVGVGEEADVEYHVGVEGDAVFEAEAETGDKQVLALVFVAEALENVGAELVDVEG